MDTISIQEQARRKSISSHARRLILDNLTVQDSDETSLLLHHENFYLQISFSELHPLMVLHLARGLDKAGTPKIKALLNDLNLNSVLGGHAINEQIGFYTYRAAQWLETEITLSRFHEILERCMEEAQRGYSLLAA